MPFLLRLYFAFATVSPPLWRLALWLRARKGKEDAARLQERFGRATIPRPAGRVLWVHAVSVGEALSLITLLSRLTQAHPDLHIVFTTVTRASADALEKRGLPPRVHHQYLPIDTPRSVQRFMTHWTPEALIVAEADTWPVLLTRAKAAGLKMMLLNTHVTERRYRRRVKHAEANGYLMGLFDQILVQDADSMERYVDLGAPADRMSLMGVLKSASDPLPDAPQERQALRAAIGTRPYWLAASTKDVEEPQVFEAHLHALQSLPTLLMLIAPRQVARGDWTEDLARQHFAPHEIARRSRGEPITPDTKVYIADTIGEMGLWYRLSPISFLGHSMPLPDQQLPGKNPYEALSVNSLVLHGPDPIDFREAYGQMTAAGASIIVQDAASLAEAVIAAQDPAFRAPYLENAARLRTTLMQPLAIALSAVRALTGLPTPEDQR